MDCGVVGRILSYYDLTDIPLSQEERMEKERMQEEIDAEKQLRDEEIQRRALERLKVKMLNRQILMLVTFSWSDSKQTL